MLGPRRLRDERGQSLVEFALASVVFFMTVFGALEFGLGVWHYNQVSSLAQEGARWASVHGTTSSARASSSDIEAFVQTRAAGLTVTALATPLAVGVPGSSVAVRVRTQFAPLTGIIPHGTFTLESTAVMIVAR